MLYNIVATKYDKVDSEWRYLILLPKKYVVQKSFRIDADLSEDLEKISEYLNRPQNELVNFALQQLMIDNKKWFADFILEEMSYDYLGNSSNCNIQIANITIDLIINQDCTTSFHYIIKHNNDEVEEDTEIFQDTEEDRQKIIDELHQISTIWLDKTSSEVQEYLKNRLAYK